jgi:hypothetical protein
MSAARNHRQPRRQRLLIFVRRSSCREDRQVAARVRAGNRRDVLERAGPRLRASLRFVSFATFCSNSGQHRARAQSEAGQEIHGGQIRPRARCQALYLVCRGSDCRGIWRSVKSTDAATKAAVELKAKNQVSYREDTPVGSLIRLTGEHRLGFGSKGSGQAPHDTPPVSS